MSTATATMIDIETVIENPLESGAVRTSVHTGTDDFDFPEHDSLQDAIFAFHRLGHNRNIADPDGAYATVHLTDDDSQELTMRFDNMGTVFLEA